MREGLNNVADTIKARVASRLCPCGGHYIKLGKDRSGAKFVLKCKRCKKKSTVTEDIGSYHQEKDAILRESIIAQFQAGCSIREACRILDIDPDVAYRIISKFGINPSDYLCTCGRPVTHPQWCWYRLKRSPQRDKVYECLALGWLKARGWNKGKGQPKRKAPPPLVEYYPYAINGSSLDGLTERVNALVPKGWHNEMRADICQEIIVDILAGEIADESKLSDALIKSYQRKYWKQYQDKYQTLSLEGLKEKKPAI